MGHAVYTLSDPRAVILKRKAKEFAYKYGIEKVYNDYKEMLADEEIDAVLVCS